RLFGYLAVSARAVIRAARIRALPHGPRSHRRIRAGTLPRKIPLQAAASRPADLPLFLPGPLRPAGSLRESGFAPRAILRGDGFEADSPAPSVSNRTHARGRSCRTRACR